ncbi:MAG: CPBP family intramembrane glutamic endopeptidase [Thermoanaerobaculia bacterium]
MGGSEALLRTALTVALALAGALTLDYLCARKGLLPPGFRVLWRRVAGVLVVAGLLAIGVFSPVGSLGLPTETDLSQVTTPQLFLLHLLMLLTMGTWFLLGFAGLPARPEPAAAGLTGELPAEVPAEVVVAPPPVPLARQFAIQFGYVPLTTVPREIGFGLLLGIGAWVVVLVALILAAGALWLAGGEDAVPKAPPALVPFIAGLPIAVRFLISLSAGFVEESFFRGFLQPRVGIVLSTLFFALAHLSYGQPFMLIGITLLSLIYGLLVKWRQNLWPAIAAHALFDGVQLLVVVPAALKMLQGTGAKAAAFLW